MSKKVNSVKASRFLDWYFGDSDNEIREFGNSMLEQLMTFGTAKISVEQLFDESWYIPQDICEDWDGNYDNHQEYSPEEIEFINDINSH